MGPVFSIAVLQINQIIQLNAHLIMEQTLWKGLSTAAILAGSACIAGAAVTFTQDFETDIAGIVEQQFATDTTSNLFQTATGTGQIGAPSFAGSFHLEIALISVDFGGLTSLGYGASWNGTNTAGSFVNNSTSSVWVYFDDPNAGGGTFYVPKGAGGNSLAGDGWWWQPTLLNPAGTTNISGGGFGIQHQDNGGFQWVVVADGDARGFENGLDNAAHPDNTNTSFGAFGSTLSISSAGWYKLETVWKENPGSGNIDQINSIYNASLVKVYEATVTGAVTGIASAGELGINFIGQDGPEAAPGETGYSGLAIPISGMGDLAIDNVTVVPEPATYAAWAGLLCLGLTLFLKRRKRA